MTKMEKMINMTRSNIVSAPLFPVFPARSATGDPRRVLTASAAVLLILRSRYWHADVTAALDETRQGRPVYTLDHRRPHAARGPILDACDGNNILA